MLIDAVRSVWLLANADIVTEFEWTMGDADDWSGSDCRHQVLPDVLGKVFMDAMSCVIQNRDVIHTLAIPPVHYDHVDS